MPHRHVRPRRLSSTWEARNRPPDPKRGTRVELIHCADRNTKLEPGIFGTVMFVDDRHTVHVQWDNGAQLGLSADMGDRFKVVDGG